MPWLLADLFLLWCVFCCSVFVVYIYNVCYCRVWFVPCCIHNVWIYVVSSLCDCSVLWVCCVFHFVFPIVVIIIVSIVIISISALSVTIAPFRPRAPLRLAVFGRCAWGLPLRCVLGACLAVCAGFLRCRCRCRSCLVAPWGS